MRAYRGNRKHYGLIESGEVKMTLALNKAGLLSLCLISLAFGTQVHAQDTLVFCSAGSPDGFDPALHTSGTTFDASSRQIYNKLVEFDRDTTVTSPALAQSYSISDDGLEYTFRLRPGVKFHATDYFTPTRDLNANDVVFSFERQRLPDNPYHQVSGGSWESFSAMSMPDLIDTVEAVDDLTVKFVLTRAEAPILSNLAMDFASILSEEYAASLLMAGSPELLDRQPVGTGPFKFVDYQQDRVIRYAAHEEYWAGKADIDTLEFAITPDPSEAYRKLKAGECHVLAHPMPGDIASMRADSNLQVLEQVGLNVGYLAYNTTVAPFDNVNVRKALNMAINKEHILEAVYRDAGRVAKNPIPPTVWSYNDAVVDETYDPVQARALLTAEGVENLSMEIWAMPVVRSYNPNAPRMAEILQENLLDIGVDVDIVLHEWGEYLRLSKELDRAGAVLYGWTGDNGDPDNFLTVLLGCDAVGGSNRAQWCYKPFDDLLTQAKVTSDQGERTRLYAQAQELFKEQAPWATIAHSVVYTTVRNNVQGVSIGPFGGHGFYGVSLTP